MQRGFRANAVLGRCTFCKFTVREGEAKFAGRYAKITHGRWICGQCLLGMRESIDEAELGYKREQSTRSELLDEMGYVMNPKTGKLERKESL